MRGACVVLLAGTMLAACTPPLDPPWLLTTPRELALQVEVVQQGPYGEPIVPGTRSPRDALPLDTLSLTPVIADANGPLDVDELEGIWILCGGQGNCLLTADELSALPTCSSEDIRPPEPCRFADGGTGTLTLADLPTAIPTEELTVFDLLVGPIVSFVASAPDGPGLDACLSRLEARQRLDGCLLMQRALGLGPLGDMVDLVIALGLDPGIGPEAETLLARPRNRNPAVEHFRLSYGTEVQEVPAGSVVAVPGDQRIGLSVVTTDEDLDRYEVETPDGTITFEDPLSAQWWFDAEVDRDDGLPGALEVSWRADGIDRVRAYVVLRDGFGGEGWGWLDLEIEG